VILNLFNAKTQRREAARINGAKSVIIRVKSFAPSALCAFALILSSCACPHRKAVTTHTVEMFMPDRADGLVSREIWHDEERGGGFFLFTDPDITSMAVIHTNQTALGGGSTFTAGPMTVIVDSNLAPAIAATGTAAGNIIGAAVKTAVK
jgi:hypothetical protein